MYTIKFAKDSRTLQIFILQKCQTKTTASPAGGIRGSDAVVCFLRTCLHKKYMWIFEHNFVADKKKIRRRAVARQVFFTQYAAKFAEKTRVYACEDRFLMLFRGFQLPQIAAQKGVKAAHCLLPSGVAVQL